MATSPLRYPAFPEPLADGQERMFAVLPEPTPEEIARNQAIYQESLRNPFTSAAYGLAGGASQYLGDVAETLDLGIASPLQQTGRELTREAQIRAPALSSIAQVDLEDPGQLLEYGMNLFGQGVTSMAPTLAGAYLTRGRSPLLGGAAPAFLLEAGETASSLADNPNLTAADRVAAASGKGAVNAALEAAVPAALVRRGAQMGLARTAISESATEAAQEAVGMATESIMDPTRDTSHDFARMLDAAIGGALTGGGVQTALQLPQAIASLAPPREPAFRSPALDEVTRPDSERLGATPEETAANLAAADAARPQHLTALAQETLAAGHVPQALKDAIQTRGIEDPVVEGAALRYWDGYRTGQTVRRAVSEVEDFFTQLRGSRKESRMAPSAGVIDIVYRHLKPELQRNGVLREALPRIARYLADAVAEHSTGELQTIREVAGLPALDDILADPRALFEELGAHLAAEQFGQRLDESSTAERDLADPRSVISTMIDQDISTTDARRIARFIDEFVRFGDRSTADLTPAQLQKREGEIREALSRVFGGPENVDFVLDHYQQRSEEDRDLYTAADTLEAGPEALEEREAAPSYRFPKPGRKLPYFKGEAGKNAEVVAAELSRGAKVTPVSMLEYAQQTGQAPGALAGEIRRELAIELEQARKQKDKNPERYEQLKQAVLEAEKLASKPNTLLDKYEVLRAEALDSGDLVATDDDMVAMRTLMRIAEKETDKKKRELYRQTFVTFWRKDKGMFKLSAESMWKTWAKKGAAIRVDGETRSQYIRRNFVEALYAVLAREDVASTGPSREVWRIPGELLIDTNGKGLRFGIEHFSGSRPFTSVRLKRERALMERYKTNDRFNAYRAALEDARYEPGDVIDEQELLRAEGQLDWLQEAVDDARTQVRTAREQLKLEELKAKNEKSKLRAKDAGAKLRRIAWELVNYERLENDIEFARQRNRELRETRGVDDPNYVAPERKGPRFYEEDTGLEIGQEKRGQRTKFDETVGEEDAQAILDKFFPGAGVADVVLFRGSGALQEHGKAVVSAAHQFYTMLQGIKEIPPELLSKLDKEIERFEANIADGDPMGIYGALSMLPKGMYTPAINEAWVALQKAIQTYRDASKEKLDPEALKKLGETLRKMLGKNAALVHEENAFMPSGARAQPTLDAQGRVQLDVVLDEYLLELVKDGMTGEWIVAHEAGHHLFTQLASHEDRRFQEILEAVDRSARKHKDEVLKASKEAGRKDLTYLDSPEELRADFFANWYAGRINLLKDETAVEKFFSAVKDVVDFILSRLLGINKALGGKYDDLIAHQIFEQFKNGNLAAAFEATWADPKKTRKALARGTMGRRDVGGVDYNPLDVLHAEIMRSQRVTDEQVEALRDFANQMSLANAAPELQTIANEAYAQAQKTNKKYEPKGARRLLGLLALTYYYGVQQKNPLAGKMTRYSKLGMTQEMTDEQKQQVVDELVRLRGEGIQIAFDRSGLFAGSFKRDEKGRRFIRIAVNVADFMGAARHEALHDFFSTLLYEGGVAGREIRKTLEKIARRPELKAKVKSLIEEAGDFPEAIAQLEDPEEVLAYAFQFWAAGKLTLAAEPRNFFQKVMKFLRDLIGVVSGYEKAEQVFAALHTGKLSEPSTAAQVLETLDKRTLGEKVTQLMGPLKQYSDRLFVNAVDQLHETGLPAAAEIADAFYRAPEREGGEGLPFLQRRARQYALFLQKYNKILSGADQAVQREALESLQRRKPARGAEARRLAGELRGLLDELYLYMQRAGVGEARLMRAENVKLTDEEREIVKDLMKAGMKFADKEWRWVPIRKVKDYFPRVWDRQKIQQNKEAFLAKLAKYVGSGEAVAIYDSMVNSPDGLAGELAENDHHVGFTPWNRAVKERTLAFIDKNNAHAEFAEFQEKDLNDTMSKYLYQAVHRAEYTRQFGKTGEWIRDKVAEARKQGASTEEAARIMKTVRGLEGTLGHDMNPRLREIMGAAVVYQNMVLLPFALFASLIDPLGIALRTGDLTDAWDAFKRGMVGVFEQFKKERGTDPQAEIAAALGVIDNQSLVENAGSLYHGMWMSRWLTKLNRGFFKYNGMEEWNRQMRIAATGAAMRFILKHKNNERYMKELGLKASDVRTGADGQLDLTDDKVRAAVYKWVDTTIIRPSAAHRPVWGSDPRFMLIFHLKQFTFSFQNVILKRVEHEAENGNLKPLLMLTTYVPFMMAADFGKAAITGDVSRFWDLGHAFNQGVDRSGVLGLGVFGTAALRDAAHGQTPGASFLGPTFDHLVRAVQTLAGAEGRSFSDLFFRSIPAGPLAKAVAG